MSNEEEEDLFGIFEGEYGEEFQDEYSTEETIVASKSTVEPVVEAPPPVKIERHFVESSSCILSTVISPFASSSSLGSTYPPASWPSKESKSDIYLQSSGKFVDGPLYPEFASPISSIETLPPKKKVKPFKHHSKVIRGPSRCKSDIILEPEVTIKKSKCGEIPYLRDVIDDILERLATFSFQFKQKLQVSINKSKPMSESMFSELTELCLPEDNFAGTFAISCDDTHDGAYIETNSCFKDADLTMGTRMFSKITVLFMVVEEKRTEFQFENMFSQEKSIHVFYDNDNYVAYRDFRDDKHVETYRGCISVACPNDFLSDGNLFALVKNLITIKYCGKFQCYTVNISGKVCRCVFSMNDKVSMSINGQFFELISLRKSTYIYGTRKKIEMTESYYLPSGLLVYHSWRNSPYIVHINPILLRNQEKLNPCMELNWKSDCILYSMLQFERENTKCLLQNYLDKYPEVIELLNDYIISLFHKKPTSVINFTCDFFENF